MTTDFIDTDSGWEGKPLECWLFVVDFVELLVDQVISKNAQILEKKIIKKEFLI